MARRQAGRPAIVERGVAISYAGLEGRALDLAAGLHAQGVRRGDRVALLFPNGAGFVTAYFASVALGAVVVPLNEGYMEVALVNEASDEVPLGEVGEITVRSHYLALGYWREPELTAAAFHGDPLVGEARTYRTGDLGRLRPDGCLEHLGRKDFQLKIGGNRVEAAEVETALLETPGVKEAMVATRETPAGEPRLVAYVVATRRPGPTVSAIRRRLAAHLPPFMIPSDYVMMDALPLNANAKVDRRALPVPSVDRPSWTARTQSRRVCCNSSSSRSGKPCLE